MAKKIKNQIPQHRLDNSKDEPIEVIDKKIYIIWIIIIIMLVVSLINTAILTSIAYVLKIGVVQFDDQFVKIRGSAKIDNMYNNDGVIKGFDAEPIDVTSDSLQLKFKKNTSTFTKMKITNDEMSFNGFKQFNVVTGNKKRNLLKPIIDNFEIPKDLKQLNVKKVHTSGVISPKNSSLTMKSSKFLQLRGNNGVHVKGKNITILADGEIYIRSINGSMYFLTNNFSINITRLPIVPISQNPTHLPTLQYKLCICMPVGSLFIVPIPANTKSSLACNFVDMSPDAHPCKTAVPERLFSE